MKFRPLHDRVLVKRVEEEKKTKGGIIIPDSAKEKPIEAKSSPSAAAAGRRGGKVRPLEVKKGDRILFGKYSGTEVKLDGDDTSSCARETSSRFSLELRETDHHGCQADPFDANAQQRILNGVNALANAVKVTLGPKGRNVLLEKSFGAPRVTKDGVSVAKEIELADKFENMGAQMVREVASKTNDVAGDGTTTATVLAQSIYREGARWSPPATTPWSIKRGIDAGVVAVVAEIAREAPKKVNGTEGHRPGRHHLRQRQRRVGKMLAKAMAKVGEEGVITIEEAKGLETELEVVEGMQFDRGYLSPYFVTNQEKMRSSWRTPTSSSARRRSPA
jgi:co-chaperonin GroES (HSP10)